MYLHGFQHKQSVRETKKYILHTILNEMIRDLTAPSTKAKQTVFLHKIKNFPSVRRNDASTNLRQHKTIELPPPLPPSIFHLKPTRIPVMRIHNRKHLPTHYIAFTFSTISPTQRDRELLSRAIEAYKHIESIKQRNSIMRNIKQRKWANPTHSATTGMTIYCTDFHKEKNWQMKASSHRAYLNLYALRLLPIDDCYAATARMSLL